MDWRNIAMGKEIISRTYCDQPYIIKTDDGAWLCVTTIGSGREGETGQHIVSARSLDKGETWLDFTDVEPAGGPEASYAVTLKIPGGRIYCFYNHNTDDIRSVKADDPPFKGGLCKRVDSLGHFVFKYSDDHGRSWSQNRYDLPVREMEIDRMNPYGGKIKFFWNVGKPFIHNKSAYVPLHKVGGFGNGFFTRSEGVLLRSANLLAESGPGKVEWETLPDGCSGLRAPAGGSIAEEQSYSVLSDGSFFCVYRTIDGHPAFSYSRDGGHTWTEPQYMRYSNGRLVRHPRAANFAWKCANGKFLYWFHNHGGRGYHDRNPAWLAGGVEVDAPDGRVIQWSQPDIVLYDDDPYMRMSYPDMVEEADKLYLSETQKNKARVHKVEPSLLEGLWNQFENRPTTSRGLALVFPGKDEIIVNEIDMPLLPRFLNPDIHRPDYGTQDLRRGFSIELWIQFGNLNKQGVILDNRTNAGQGFCLQAAGGGVLEILLNDGCTQNSWCCDHDLLKEREPQHVVVTVDGGPKIITFIINGVLCDGGGFRQFGWGRFSPNLRHVNGSEKLKIGGLEGMQIMMMRIYNVALRTFEAVANFKAGGYL